MINIILKRDIFTNFGGEITTKLNIMFEWFYTLFSPVDEPEMTQSLIVLFMAISVGFFVGKLKIGSVSLGVSAVMFVGLFLGHLGYSMNVELIQFVREFGLILFVYGIGIQVGPTFFSSFKKEGLIFNALGVGTVFLGGIITYLIHLFANVKIETIRVSLMNTIQGEEAARAILAMPKKPTAIFCANDLLALGVMRILNANKVKVPDQMSVLGYDNIEFASSAGIPLSSIAQPAYQMGVTAANLLLDECEAGDDHRHQQIRFQPQLVERASTAAAPK